MLSNEVSVEIEILRKHGLSLRRIAQEVGCAVNTVRRHLALGEAPSHGQTIIMHDATSKGAVNYLNLAREILQKNSLTRIPDSERTVAVEA